MASGKLLRTLVRYGNKSAENYAKMETWFEASMDSIAAGNGGQVTSASANGASFTTMTGAMSNTEWANLLDQALHMIDNGIKYQTTSRARVL